ncbi:MAG: type II secretion system F family protein [Actinomycetes bacterium]
MGSVLGLLLGGGLFCVWWSCWVPDERRTRRAPLWLQRVRDELTQAGMATVSPQALLGASAVCVATTGLLVVAFSGSVPIAVCFGAIGGWAPVALVRMRARRRRTTVRELWPEAVDHLTSGIRAGLSLPEALAQLGERGPSPLRPSFAAFGEDYRATGRFSDSLENLKQRLADPVADRIVEALRVTREVGGSDLGSMLRTLSAFLREDVRTRSELEARQSWTVNAARLAVAAPWVVLGLLATRPEAVDAYNKPQGVLVLAIGAASSVLAYRVMVRIGRLPDEDRVLR